MFMYIFIINSNSSISISIIIYNINCFLHAIATTHVFRDTVHDLYISTCFYG